MSVVTVIIFILDHNQIRELEQEVAELENASHALVESANKNEKSVYLLSRDIKAGEQLKQEDVILVGLNEDIKPNNTIEALEDIVGKTLKIHLAANTPVTEDILHDFESISDDLRRYEMSLLFLPSLLEKNDAIDVRIKFPTGQDYIVLTKKRVEAIERLQSDNGSIKETLWMMLNEEEILRIASACVDAYLHEGTKLYALQYVDAVVQSAAQVTYPVNQAVLELMLADPNLVFQSKEALELRKREELEDHLYAFHDEETPEKKASSLRVNQENGLIEENKKEQDAFEF